MRTFDICAYRQRMRAPETFETERLRLRPVQRMDAADIFQYAGEIPPTRFMPFQRHQDIADSLAFAQRCEGCWIEGSAFPWAVTEKMSERFLGVLELRLSPPKADFGYIFAEPFWGKGFATEAASAVVAWAIAQPSILRVWATCHPSNVASAAVLRRAGLSYEATLASWEARPQIGEVAGPSDCYALTRSATG
ncbi:GNAT family N-acetyltransferase [Brevundimonas naejangsanensis]|uniref:GNAT family N-acetyltransferase n=1 Tax=Brevundimonas naejangsanensis TaxID=588932 RepID=UPI0011A1ED19|nr:GNAT family N-acetyltransferase [Brevundimonas naejangsanensis]